MAQEATDKQEAGQLPVTPAWMFLAEETKRDGNEMVGLETQWQEEPMCVFLGPILKHVEVSASI